MTRTTEKYKLQSGEELDGVLQQPYGDDGLLLATKLEDLDSWARDNGWESADQFLREMGTGWTEINGRWFMLSLDSDAIIFMED